MPNYGSPTAGTQATYDGTHTREPTTPEWLLQILHAIGEVATVDRAVYTHVVQSPLMRGLYEGEQFLGENLATSGFPEFGLPIYGVGRFGEWLANSGGFGNWLDHMASLRDLRNPAVVVPEHGYIPATHGVAGFIATDTGAIRSQGVPLEAGQADDIANAVADISVITADAYGDVDYESFYSIMSQLWSDLMLRYASEGRWHNKNKWFSWLKAYPQGYAANMAAWRSITGLTPPAVPDFTTALEDETVLAFLQRTQPTYNWTHTTPGGIYANSPDVFGTDPGASYMRYKALFTYDDLHPAQAGAAAIGVPVWPGLSGVTLGSEVPLDASVHVAGPFDGVIVQLDVVPTIYTHYDTPSGTRYYRLGWVAFQNDDGAFEQAQLIEWPVGVFAPTTMQHCAGVDIWCRPGVSGSITPWTINTA